MVLQKGNMTVLAQIVELIPAKIIDSLAKKYKIQTRAFSPTSHVVTLLYEHLAHSDIDCQYYNLFDEFFYLGYRVPLAPFAESLQKTTLRDIFTESVITSAKLRTF